MKNNEIKNETISSIGKEQTSEATSKENQIVDGVIGTLKSEISKKKVRKYNKKLKISDIDIELSKKKERRNNKKLTTLDIDKISNIDLTKNHNI